MRLQLECAGRQWCDFAVLSIDGEFHVSRLEHDPAWLPSIMPKLAKMQTPNRATAAQRSVDMFALFSGSHFDPSEHLRRSQISVDRSFRPAGTGRQTAAIMASPDRTPALRKLDLPALVIHGLMDKLVRPSGGTATAAAIPGSRLLMFPDMGHDVPEPRQQEIVDAIRRNADSARPAARSSSTSR
jgi:pimeloyl-ACP methyl ester carboxylesterase